MLTTRGRLNPVPWYFIYGRCSCYISCADSLRSRSPRTNRICSFAHGPSKNIRNVSAVCRACARALHPPLFHRKQNKKQDLSETHVSCTKKCMCTMHTTRFFYPETMKYPLKCNSDRGRTPQVHHGRRRGVAQRAAQVDPLLQRREGDHVCRGAEWVQPGLVRGHQSQPVREWGRAYFLSRWRRETYRKCACVGTRVLAFFSIRKLLLHTPQTGGCRFTAKGGFWGRSRRELYWEVSVGARTVLVVEK